MTGVDHTERVADELGDVAFTALVAAASLGYHPRELLAQVAAKVLARLGPAPSSPRAATDDTSADPASATSTDGRADEEGTVRAARRAAPSRRPEPAAANVGGHDMTSFTSPYPVLLGVKS